MQLWDGDGAEIPAHATVYVPIRGGILETGLRPVRVEDSFTVFLLGSGVYRFKF